jgi:hypothetical protein
MRAVCPASLQLSLQDADLTHQRQRATSPGLLQEASLKALLRKALDLGEDRWGESIFSHVVPLHRGETKAKV